MSWALSLWPLPRGLFSGRRWGICTYLQESRTWGRGRTVAHPPHPHCSELQSSASPALLTQQPLTFILPSHTLQCLLCLDCSFQPFPWLGPGFLTPTAYLRGPCLSPVAFPPQLVRISEIRFGYVSAGSLRTHSPSLLPEGRTLSVSPEQD